MPARLKKVHKIDVLDHAAVQDIHLRYFVSIGLACESGLPYHSAEWHAAFKIKFGRPEYRREAWAQVRGQVRHLIPAQEFVQMDAYFSEGAALHFTQGFDLETKQRMLAAITKHTSQNAALLKLPDGMGKGINTVE